MKLELIADSFYCHKRGNDPYKKGDVIDYPESYLKVFPNTFKIWIEKLAAESVEIPEVEITEPDGEDLLEDVQEHVYSKTEITRMNGEQLKAICPSLEIDVSEYETVKALRKAVEVKLFNEGAV